MFDNSAAGRYTYTEPEFARRVGLSVALVRQLRHQGRLSHIKINKRILYTDEDLQALLASHRSSAGKEGK
jgi:cellulase/cellobiase CelA1